MHRCDTTVSQCATHQNVIRGGDAHFLLGIHFQPFPGLRADDGGHGAEIANDKAQRVDGVAAGDGQGIGAHLSVPLPGPVGGPFQDPLLNPADVTRHDCPNIAGLHQFLSVQKGRSSSGLESHEISHPPGAGQLGHLLGFGRVTTQGPLGIDMLSSMQGCHRRLIMGRHSQDHSDGIDVRVVQHFTPVVKGQLRPEFGSGLFGALLAGSAHRRQLKGWAGDNGGQMSAGGPPPVYVSTYNPQTYLVCHTCTLSCNVCLSSHSWDALASIVRCAVGLPSPGSPHQRHHVRSPGERHIDEAGAYGTHSFLSGAPRWEYLMALVGRRSIFLSGGTGDPADSYKLGTFRDASTIKRHPEQVNSYLTDR